MKLLNLNVFEKFQKEIVNIVKDYKNFIHDGKSSLIHLKFLYSTEEYGPLAPLLNRFKEMFAFSKKGN